LIVELCADTAAAEQADAIGLTSRRLDQPAFAQALEQGKRTVGERMAFAGEAGDVGYLAIGPRA
jgi:hypothetical protein